MGTGRAHAPPAQAERAASPAPGGAPYTLASLAAQDIAAVARVHVESFGDTFLARLGIDVLRHFYAAFLDYPEACAFVCRDSASGAVVGFVCGTENLRHHYRWFVRRRALPAASALLARALRDRAIARGMLRRARSVGGLLGAEDPPRAQSGSSLALAPAHLMSMAVRPGWRGAGVGAALVRAFTDEMARRGVRSLVLGVRDENTAARRLYERLGWRPALREQALDGSASWLYVYDTGEAGAGAVGEV